MNTKEILKASIHAPCVTFDSKGKRVYPHVDCEWECDNCPWNPGEQARRLKTGTWINGSLNFKRRVFVSGT